MNLITAEDVQGYMDEWTNVRNGRLTDHIAGRLNKTVQVRVDKRVAAGEALLEIAKVIHFEPNRNCLGPTLRTALVIAIAAYEEAAS